ATGRPVLTDVYKRFLTGEEGEIYIDLDFLAGQEALVDIGQHWSPGREIDVRGPVHFDQRMRRDQLAVGAIHDVQEAVLVRLDHHLAWLSVDLDVGEHLLVVAVDVVDVVWRVLVVARDFAGLRTDG